MGISQDSWHKRRKTGGRRPQPHKKRKYELGRPAANTKLAPKRIHDVRVRGGNIKKRAQRLDHGNFSWASQAISRKARIIDTVYNASNNELVRTKTLVKNTIVQIDAAPLKQWYEAHYLKEIGRKKSQKKVENDETEQEVNVLNQKRSSSCMEKYEARQKLPAANIEAILKEQFLQGSILACISSRPGQVGRADGYILEGKELEFYSKKLKAKKSK